MGPRYQFNRMEFSGSLGDLGTLLPLALGMILINGMPVTGILYSIGLFYIVAGLYFGVPVPVQPMKAIGAYAIATGIAPSQVAASAGLISLILLFIGLTGIINLISTLIPKEVIRGIQLSTGVLLMSQGVKLIQGGSLHQLAAHAVEPTLAVQSLGPLPITLILGVAGTVCTLFFFKSSRYPAGIILIGTGLLIGLLLGKNGGFDGFAAGVHFPELLPFGFPATADFTIAFLVLVLPQIPMTVGNAIIANTDLSREYFGDDSQKVTYKTTTMSMAFANGLCFLFGGIPLCHGAGGLAAHYGFGARTGGSNIIIGVLFLLLALFFGPQALTLLKLLPLSILGVLLIFAGSQLGLSILDMLSRKKMFTVLVILAITLTTNLAWGFLVGTVLAHLLRSERFSV